MRPRSTSFVWSLFAGSLILFSAPSPPVDGARSDADAELAAARALFEANLQAIRDRDREGYLRLYRDAENLVRTGPTGPALGFEGLEAAAGEAWPDLFEGRDLQVVHLQPGLVYGSYRYRVRYGDDEQLGISERLFLRTEEGWRIATTSAFPSPPGTPPPPLALVGATLLDGTGGGAVADSVVVLRNGDIDCAGSRTECPVPDGIDVEDLSGLWITPGLVDAHVHFSQTGWTDGRPDALDLREHHPYEEVQARLRRQPEALLGATLCAGVTTVFDVGGYPWTWDLARRSRDSTRGPRVVASGPLLSTLDFWLNLPGENQFLYIGNPERARGAVAYLDAHGAPAAKVWFIPVAEKRLADLDGVVRAAGEEAARRGLPLLVHATGLREAKVAVRAGAHLLVHSVWDREVDTELVELILERGTIYTPTLTVGRGYQRLFESAAGGEPPEIDDPNSCVDLDTLGRLAETPRLGSRRDGAARAAAGARRLEARERLAAANLRRLHDAGVPIAMGTDAGNPLTLHGPAVYAEMEAMQAAGMSPGEVLAASTRGGARAVGLEERIGTVEVGKSADLLVVAADPALDIANLRRLRYVIRGGVMRSIEELRAQ